MFVYSLCKVDMGHSHTCHNRLVNNARFDLGELVITARTAQMEMIFALPHSPLSLALLATQVIT